MDENRLREFLKENSEYRRVLKNAVIYEDQHSDEEHLTGWIFGVDAKDSQVREMVHQGIAKMSFDGGKMIDFRLTDRELVRKVLRMKTKSEKSRE